MWYVECVDVLGMDSLSDSVGRRVISMTEGDFESSLEVSLV